MRGIKMSDFNWCHGPQCHEKHTVDRVRGVKGSKVLRTRKIKANNWNRNNVWSHFCSQGCYTDFMNTYWAEQIALHPRTECLETPILDPTRTKHENSYYNYYDTKIEVDESRQS